MTAESLITQLFTEHLQIEVPSTTTDLIDEGLLDSLLFVDLIMHLEQQFEITIDIANLEIDQFRTIARIAAVVAGATKPMLNAEIVSQ